MQFSSATRRLTDAPAVFGATIRGGDVLRFGGFIDRGRIHALLDLDGEIGDELVVDKTIFALPPALPDFVSPSECSRRTLGIFQAAYTDAVNWMDLRTTDEMPQDGDYIALHSSMYGLCAAYMRLSGGKWLHSEMMLAAEPFCEGEIAAAYALPSREAMRNPELFARFDLEPSR
jgi:hypothetical protein